MKFLKYISIWLGVILIFACVAGYVYIRIEGKALFERQLAKFFGQPTQIEEIRYLIPAGVRLKKLDIKNIVEAEDVRLHLKIPFLLKNYFVIARLELIEPVFHMVRHEKKKIDFGGMYLNKQEEKFHPEKRGTQRVIQGILIDFLSVTDGRVEVLDLSVPDPVKYDAGSIKGKAMKVLYPLEDQNIKFDIEGVILNVGGKALLKNGFFSVTGWINWPARAMAASLDFRGEEGAFLNMDLKGENNIIQAKGHIEFGAVEQKVAEQAKEMPAQSFAEVMFGALQASQSRLGMNFAFETKMDSFSLKLVDFDGVLDLPKQKKGLEALNPAVFFGVEKESGVQN